MLVAACTWSCMFFISFFSFFLNRWNHRHYHSYLNRENCTRSSVLTMRNWWEKVTWGRKGQSMNLPMCRWLLYWLLISGFRFYHRLKLGDYLHQFFLTKMGKYMFIHFMFHMVTLRNYSCYLVTACCRHDIDEFVISLVGWWVEDHSLSAGDEIIGLRVLNIYLFYFP